MWKKRGSTPKADTMLKLAKYFKTTPDYLAGKEGAVRHAIHFDTTPDPEWLEFEELKKKQENGTITQEELRRAGELFEVFTKRNAESLMLLQEKIDAFADSFKQQIINQQVDVLPIMLESLKSMASLISDFTPPKRQSEAQLRTEELTEIPKYQCATPPETEKSEPD